MEINSTTGEYLSVSARNVNVLLNFCKKREISTEPFLENLPYPSSYIKNPDNWIPLPVFTEITHRVKHAFNDDSNIFYHIGLTCLEEGNLGLVDLLIRILGIGLSTESVIRKVPQYNTLFNRTKTFEILDSSTSGAIIKIQFLPEFNAVDDYHSGPFIRGIIASLPKLWGAELAHVEEVLLEYDPVDLLKRQFNMLAEIKSGKLYVENEEYGKEVELVAENIKQEKYFLGAYKNKKQGHHTAILITKDLTIGELSILQKNQLYKAPYFILKVSWNNISLLRKLKYIFMFPLWKRNLDIKDFEERVAYFQQYSKQLEITVQKRNKEILKQKDQIEYLHGQMQEIMASQLPADIVESMTKGKLHPRKNSGIVLFADLVRFSETLHNSKQHEEVIQDLRKYFEIANYAIKSRGGWIYKYLGDGIMAVFGGHKRDEDYHALALAAISAAEKVRSQVHDMNWNLRIGIEYGNFFSGEIGPQNERIWDFLGNTVNFAFRLQQEALENDILLGPECYELIKDEIEVEKCIVSMKGLGQQPAFTYKGKKLRTSKM